MAVHPTAPSTTPSNTSRKKQQPPKNNLHQHPPSIRNLHPNKHIPLPPHKIILFKAHYNPTITRLTTSGTQSEFATN